MKVKRIYMSKSVITEVKDLGQGLTIFGHLREHLNHAGGGHDVASVMIRHDNGEVFIFTKEA